MEPIIEEFLQLCRIDCASRNERAVADYMTAALTALGCTVEEDDAAHKVGGNAGNLIARLSGTQPGCLLLSAHMDRVKGGCGVRPCINETPFPVMVPPF